MTGKNLLPESPRILIVRLSAIGDVVQSLPLLCALRERFPKAFLAWATEHRAAVLLERHEALDELVVLQKGWLKRPTAVWQLRRRLHDMKLDVAIDAQGLTRSAIVARLSGARRRIGFGNPWGRELSRWLNNETVDTTAEHAVDRNVELLRPLGIVAPTIRFNVPEDPADRDRMETLIREAGLQRGFAIINPGAGWPSKLWLNDRFAAVAVHLQDRHSLPTLVVYGNNEERIAAQEIVSHSEGRCLLAPRTSLKELAALARRARLFIGSDTGPLHLAAATGTPCIGLYGPWPAKRHGPYGPENIALQKKHFEGPTRARRKAPRELMEAITVDAVCEACDQILARPGRPEPAVPSVGERPA